jgi:alanyl-tRNA synthetase
VGFFIVYGIIYKTMEKLMSRKYDHLKVKKTDSPEEAKDKNTKLLRKIKSLERENKQLKSKNHTLNKAWDETETYLEDITEGRPLKEIVKDVSEGKLRKLRKECPSCSGKRVKKIQFSGFHVIVCEDCKYRKKIDEKIPE